MKTDKHNMDVEQLLATLEHAGRDRRRQQELGDMLDRMAGEDSGTKKRGFWWWSTRVAAAACFFFLISTTVRIWVTPTDNSVQVAQTEVPTIPEIASGTSSAVVDNEGVAAPSPVLKVKRPSSLAVDTPEQQPKEPLLAEEVTEPDVEEPSTEEPADSAVAPTVIIEDDFAPDAELVAESVDEEPVETIPPTAQPAEPKKAPRGSFLRSLLCLAEPSNMDGTTLAFLEF